MLRAEIAEESNKKLTQEINYRKKLQNELVSQTTKYEAIFNNTSHLIWTVDSNLIITSFNTNYFNYIKMKKFIRLSAKKFLRKIIEVTDQKNKIK